jgi:hypothetical protein
MHRSTSGCVKLWHSLVSNAAFDKENALSVMEVISTSANVRLPFPSLCPFAHAVTSMF